MAMGVEAKQDASCSIKKTLRCAVRTTWRCAFEYRALFSLLLLLYLLYKYSPGFFAFLLSNSPVIVCTSILLGVLISYGGAHLPEINEDRKSPEGISAAPKFEISSRNVNIEGDQTFSVPAVKENIIREASFGRRDSNKCIDLDESLPLLKGPDLQDLQDERVDAAGGRPVKILTSVPSMGDMKTYVEKGSEGAFLSWDKGDEYANLFEDVHQSKSRVDGKEATLGVYSSSENAREDAEMVATPNYEGRVCTDSQSGEVVDDSEHKAVDGAAGKCRWGRAFSVRRRKKLFDIKIEAVNSVVDNQLENPLCSPLTGVGSHDSSSGFDPGNAERGTPDVSMTGTSAVLDETEPLLDADCSRPHRITNDEPGNHSSIASHDSQVESESNDVADNSKAKDDGEEKKDARTEPALLWTADNEKNVMDLGYSEIERNRRLETLMVRRKSRKNIRFELDSMGDIADDLSHSRLQPISILSRQMNPFTDDAELPGSAPPILHPQKSPFNFLTEQSAETGDRAHHNLEPQESMAVSHQDTLGLFKRHESFNIGRPPQRHGSRFKPCFVLEEFQFDEAGAGSFQRQFSDRSVSRLSIVSECDTVSSVGDQEHNELIRNYIRGVRESPSLLRQDSDLACAGNECSDGISFVDSETLNAVIC